MSGEIILAGVLTALLAGWVLWAWTVAEGRDIKWLRITCARAFVVLVFVLGAGTGFVLTRIQMKAKYRAEIRKFSDAVQEAIASDPDGALEQLRRVLNPPDEWSTDSPDMLDRLSAEVARAGERPASPADADSDAIPRVTAERPQPIRRQ